MTPLEKIIIAIAGMVVVLQVATVMLNIRSHRIRMANARHQGEQIDRMLDGIEELVDMAGSTTDLSEKERINAEIQARLAMVAKRMEGG